MNSHEAVAWAIRVSKGEPMAARMLLIVGLASRAGGKNGAMVYPSVRQIADDTDMSRASVQRWLRHLEEKGLVQTFVGTRKSGARSSNIYHLPVKSAFFHPTKGPIFSVADQDDDADGEITPEKGPQFEAGKAAIEAGPASYGEACSEQPLEQPIKHNEETDGELPLGLEPLLPKDPTPEDLAVFIEKEWAARAFLAPLRGGKLNESMKEKAVKLARSVMVDGDTILTIWRDMFSKIDGSDWLQGNVPGKDGRDPFRLSMPTLLQKRIFDKAIGGAYDGKSTGQRKRGSTSTATGNFLDRLRSGQSRGAGGGSSQRALARN